MAPRKRCPVCRSKQWHKEPSSGLIACSEGHILQNYRNETSELDEAGPHVLKKRTLKSNRLKVHKHGRADPKLYHGNRGRYFYFQCLQLILRHQVAILMERWELPTEFEIVCRDMWALHLSLLRIPPPPEPYLGAQESDEEPQADSPGASLETETESPAFEDPKPPSSDSETEGEPANDPELDELLAENSASESSSDGEGEADTKRMPPGSKAKRHNRHKNERIDNTLAVIIVACWTLRVPILYRDLTRLIELYELPYLEATRVLPPDMTMHLTKHNIQALSPPNTPDVLVLHNLASSLAKRIYSTFDVLTPQVNAAPILWRVVAQGLGGTPTLYRLTKRLSTVLELPLTLHQSLAPRLQRPGRGRQPGSHTFDNVAPEVAFLATGIIVLKLVYGLDGKPRLPADPEDPASDLARIDEYLELLRRLDDADSQTRDAQFHSKTVMVIEDLCDDTVDEYLAFCERALVGPANEHDVLERYFPLRASQRTGEAIATEDARPQLRGTRLQDGDEEVLRPGAEYTLSHSEEMPDEYAAIMSRAAKWARVGEEDLSGAVVRYERRLVGWWRKRRGDVEGDSSDAEGGST